MPVFSRHANASPLLLTLLRGLFCALWDENHCCQNHHRLRLVRACKLPAVPAQVLLLVLGRRATLFSCGIILQAGCIRVAFGLLVSDLTLQGLPSLFVS
jgi:hypothetical protein